LEDKELRRFANSFPSIKLTVIEPMIMGRNSIFHQL